MGNRWEDLESLFVSSADSDLREHGEAQPAFAAFASEQLLFLAWLRHFDKGEYADPLIELLALAVPLCADRLAVSMSARVWSLDDPIPPVTEGTDLRQQVLAVTFVDGAHQGLDMWTMLHPFDLDAGEPVWHSPQRLDGGEGWIGQALQKSVLERGRMAARPEKIRQQAIRLDALGHQLFMSAEVLERFGGAAV